MNKKNTSKPKKPNTRKEIVIYIPIYDFTLYVYQAPDWDKYLKEKVGKSEMDDFPFSETDAVTCHLPSRSYAIASRKVMPTAVLVHECLHVVLSIADRLELSLESGSNEAVCYLMDFIIKKIGK